MKLTGMGESSLLLSEARAKEKTDSHLFSSAHLAIHHQCGKRRAKARPGLVSWSEPRWPLVNSPKSSEHPLRTRKRMTSGLHISGVFSEREVGQAKETFDWVLRTMWSWLT